MDRRKQTKQKMGKNTRIEDDIWKGTDGRKEGRLDGRTDRQIQ